MGVLDEIRRIQQIKAAAGVMGPGASPTLEQTRQQIIDNYSRLGGLTQTAPEFQQVAGFHQQAPAQALMAQLQGRAAGTDVPFTPSVIATMVGQDVGAANRAMQNQNALVRQQMARSGMSGSGMELSALINARRAAAASARAARSRITSRAHLSNFQARERAQQQIQGYLQQQLQNQQFMAAQAANLQAQSVGGANQFLEQTRQVQQGGQNNQGRARGGFMVTPPGGFQKGRGGATPAQASFLQRVQQGTEPTMFSQGGQFQPGTLA